MNRLLHEYLEYGRRQNFKDSTLRDWRYCVGLFFKFVEEDYPDIIDITDITRDIALSFEKYLITLKGRSGRVVSISRRRRYLMILRGFFRYLALEEMIYSDPWSRVALPRERSGIVKDVLSIEEMESLLGECGGHTVKSLRDRAILELLYSTGIRADELCGIELNDIDLEERQLFVRNGKLGNQRLIPFGGACRYWVERYMDRARPFIMGSENIYIDRSRNILFLTLRGGRFRPNSLCRIVKSYALRAGIEKNVTTHTFRHSCAVHMLKGRADIRYVQRQLGHRSISTTEKYLRLEIADLKEAHARCHPREQEDWE